jgi:CheY-like chemotaxis protein
MHGKNSTVLVVDDNLEMHEIARAVLEPAGHRVLSALDGKEALELLVAMPEPDLIVLDFRMPVMEGQELLGILRAYSRLAQIPIVIVSADDNAESYRRVVEGFLAKPVKPQALLRTIEDVLVRRAS